MTKVKRKLFLSISILLCCLFAGSTVFAYPVFQNSDGVNYDVMMFENVETWVDSESVGEVGYGIISVGDQFYGIVSVQNIKYGTEESSSEIWSASNSGTIDSFTGYFANTVTNVDAIPNSNDFRITLGAGDALGKLTGKEVVAFYVDDGPNATGYTTDKGVSQDILNATDGNNLWATFGLVDSTTDYLYTEAPVVPPGVAHHIGMTFGGLSIIQDNTNLEELLSINDPIEDFMDTFVDLYYRSYLGQIIDVDSGDGSKWYFVSNDPGGIKPVPEPATMLLLGSGLIGLAGFARKKRFFKKG